MKRDPNGSHHMGRSRKEASPNPNGSQPSNHDKYTKGTKSSNMHLGSAGLNPSKHDGCRFYA